jgi:glycosyltransferase involved in cell wall biosynthesis
MNQELLALTRAFVESVRMADPNVQLVIVDDGSDFGGGFLRELADLYIRHSKNLGYLHAVNHGLKVADGKYIAVAGNDEIVAPNIFDVAEDILENNPEVYSVHPKMIEYNEPIKYGEGTWLYGKERWCQTSFWVIRNELPFLFDANFKGTGGAYEDYDLWATVRKQGWQTAYTNRTVFGHKDSSTTRILGEQSKKHQENLTYFKSKCGKEPAEYYQSLYPDQWMLPWRPLP